MINEILRQDEDGRTEAEFPNPHALAPIFRAPAPDTHCLQYIDPYGDTVLNGQQVRRLMDELRERIGAHPAELQHHIRQLIGFLESAADEVHTYVKFVGD